MEGYKKSTQQGPENIVINSRAGGKTLDALVIYNGKEYSWKEYEALKVEPATIESIDVLKNESAIAKYGDKGKNGVIIIKSK